MDATATPPRSPADAAPPRTALSRRIVPPGIDGRTRGAKRLAELVHHLAARVADPEDVTTRARLVDAAHLTMVSESLAHRAAAGEPVDPDLAVRVSGALGRALDRLEDCR